MLTHDPAPRHGPRVPDAEPARSQRVAPLALGGPGLALLRSLGNTYLRRMAETEEDPDDCGCGCGGGCSGEYQTGPEFMGEVTYG
ncbi:hypothetical protein ABZ907_38855 [Nonomuraea wenchangensis]